MRIGLYLGDLRRSQTDSHGIVNYAVGLANHLPRSLSHGEELVLFVGDEVRSEISTSVADHVDIVDVVSPQTTSARLRMDHAKVLTWARCHGLDLLHFPKGHIPLGRISDLRLVATVHDDIPLRYSRGEFGIPSSSLKARYMSWATLHALRRADQVLTVSSFSAQSLLKHVPSARSRLAVIPNGVSLPLLDRTPRSDKKQLLVHLGSRLPHKRSAEVIRWTWDFLDEHPAYRLVVTGSLDEAAEGLCGHPQIIRERRILTNLEIAELLRDAVALLFPSSYEGFGLPPVEAACLGTGSVWAAAASLPEVMRDAPGGFAPGDRGAFLAALSQVVALGDAELESLRKSFTECYSWDRVATETLDTYRRVLARQPTRATLAERLVAAVVERQRPASSK